MGSIVTRLDDRDPRIQYSGIWGNSGTELDYLNTTTFTIFAGSGVLFNFTGTGVSVYGRIGPTGFGYPPVSNYTIDSGVPYQLNATQKGEDQHQQLFFRARGLGLGNHTLGITNVLENDVLTLDYLEVETTSDGSSGNSTMPISSSLTATATQSATITALQTVSKSTTTTRVGPPIGATIGGAIAGSMIISLILLLFVFFFARKRRRRRKKNLALPDSLSSPQLPAMSQASAGYSGSSDITPFVIEDPPGSFAGPSLRKHSTLGYGHGVDRDTGSSVPEGVVRHFTQLPFSTGGREKSHGDLPPRYTASSDVG